MGFCWYHIETFFMFLTFIMINKTFTLKLFLSSNKFGIASNIWSCLLASITRHNVATVIVNNEPQKLWLPDILEFTLFSFRTLTFISILAWYFRRCCIRQTSFTISWFNRLFLARKKWKNVLFLHIVVTFKRVKSTWFKTFVCESIVR